MEHEQGKRTLSRTEALGCPKTGGQRAGGTDRKK